MSVVTSYRVKPTVSPRLLRIPLAAQYIGATNWFVEELCRNRQIAYLTVGKYRVIDIRELDRWIEAQQLGAVR
jgi:hypothetical protein